MRVGMGLLALLASTMLGPVSAPTASAQASARKLPYWASIAQPIARMRKGPSPDMPVTWEYRRDGLPVKVIGRYQSWRKVQDPDRTIGWMQSRLLSAQRTGIVVGGIRPMHVSPDASAAVAWRTEPGVVGKIDDCEAGWCEFDAGGKRGYIRAAHVWGAGAP